MSQKTYTASVVRAGSLPMITISTADQDRDGDIVVPTGGDFRSYRKNPVVLWGHDHSAIPIGRCMDLQADTRAIKATFTWLQGDPFADRVKNAFDQNIVNAASIGFRPINSEPNGLGGLRFTQWELLEFSLVPIPANPMAVRTLKALGLWSGDEMIDVDEADVLAVLPEAIGDAVKSFIVELGPLVRRETERAVQKARGRIVDDVDFDPLGDRVHKHGRVLSAANEQRVRGAQDAVREADRHLGDVLNSMGDDGDEIAVELDD